MAEAGHAPPGAHLSDDGVVGGGDGVEDSLDAPQRLLAPRGDAVEGFIVVLQGPTALAAGAGKTRNKREGQLKKENTPRRGRLGGSVG